MKPIAFVLLFIGFGNCSVKYVRTSDGFKKELSSLKRISVVVEKNLAQDQEDLSLVKELTRNYISHHKEFIVYNFEEHISCESTPKLQGLFFVKLREMIKPDEIRVQIFGKLKSCKTGEELWSALSERKVALDSLKNASLVKTYTEKFGKKIEIKVTPYFLVIKDLLDELESPSPLTEEEQNEKIEVES